MEERTTEMMEKFSRLEGLIRRYQGYIFRAYGPWGNPMKGQGRVLAILKLQPVISQKELSYLLDMRQQSLSELLAKLERAGYITRYPSEEDRRVTIVSLTDAGREAAEKMSQEENDVSRVFNVLSDEEKERLAEYMDRLADALEDEMENIAAQNPDVEGWERAKAAGMDYIKKHMAEWGFGAVGAWGHGPGPGCEGGGCEGGPPPRGRRPERGERRDARRTDREERRQGRDGEKKD